MINETIRMILFNQPECGEDDMQLMFEVWRQEAPHAFKMDDTGEEWMDVSVVPQLTKAETIRRTRQKIQSEKQPLIRDTQKLI